MGLSDYPKLVPFTLEIRHSSVQDGHQSGACATTQGLGLLLPCVHIAVLLRFLRFSSEDRWLCATLIPRKNTARDVNSAICPITLLPGARFHHILKTCGNGTRIFNNNSSENRCSVTTLWASPPNAPYPLIS